MGEEKSQNNIKWEILNKINSGEISMRPKSYFVLKVVLLIALAFIILITSIFLLSYIIFSLIMGGRLLLLGYGGRGLIEFIIIFPWVLFLIDILLLLAFDWLLKEFRFSYHSPKVYLFLGTFILITGLGGLIYRTQLNMELLNKAENHNLPFGGQLYGGLRKSHRNMGIFRGVISEIGTSTFVIKYDDYDTPEDDGYLDVITPGVTDLSALLHKGDEVFVAGDLENGVVRAYGVSRLDQ